MKASDFKKIIKESVREVIQEELKDILLEALKSNNKLLENKSYKKDDEIPSKLDMSEFYKNIVGDEISLTSQNTGPKYQPRGGDIVNGTLPEGSVDLGSIMGLLK